MIDMIIKLKFIIIHYNYHNSNFHHIGIITWSFEITLSDHVCLRFFKSTRETQKFNFQLS